MSPGYAQLVNAAEVEPVTSGDHPELESCKRVQALAVQASGDPPSP